jgi:HK97 family phage major capsid protein
MAITAASVGGDFNAAFRQPSLAGFVFERAANSSVVQQLVPQIPLGGNGVTVPVVTTRPQLGWVGEAEAKPATSGAFDVKSIVPKKIAAILVVSKEVVRANPGGYVATMRNELADAFAIAFDRAALHDEGPTGTGGAGPFSTYIDQTTKVSEIGAANAAGGGVHTDFVNALSDIVTTNDSTGRRRTATGWALDTALEPALWGSLDSTGRPLYLAQPSDTSADVLTQRGRLLGRPTFMSAGVASADMNTVVGYLGDWNQARWGVVGGIEFSSTDEAAVTINGSLVSTWQNNLIAIKAEAEYGFLVNDVDAFSKLTNTNATPVTSS